MPIPIVSVLMTTFNRASLVGEAIESVLASDFSDFELIICDDASSDNTVEICRRYQALDSRIKVFVNENNLGDYPNRNKAASFAVGKYIKYVDSDDLIYPWALGQMVRMMDRFPNAGWGLCSMEPNLERQFPFSLTPAEIYRYHYFGPGLFRRAPLSSIIKKVVFDQIGGFRPYRMVGDFDMWQRLAVNFDVLLMPQGMVWYRSHGSQEIKDLIKYLPDYERIKLEHLQSPNCPLSKNEIVIVIRKEKRKVFKHLISCLFRGKFREFVIIFRIWMFYFK
jgi:glycosyltransferase involved in cell wall biosynthesis